MENEFDIILTLLERYGLRIGEILTLRHERIINDTMIFQGEKGSRDRYVNDSEVLRAIRKICGEFVKGRVFTLNYGDVYREMTRRGLTMNGIRRRRVTTRFRHQFIRQLSESGMGVDDIKEEVGHKRRETTLYYLNQI
jgi:integrase